MSVNKLVTKVDGTINKTIDFNDLKAGLAAGSHTITVEAWNGSTLVSTQTKNITIASSDTTSPTITTATVEDANPDKLVVVFSEVVTITNTTGLTITGDATPTLSAPTGSGSNTITFTLSTALTNGQSVTLNVASSNTIKDAANNALAATTKAITNNVGAVSSFEAETTTYMNTIAIPDNSSASIYTGKTNRDIWVLMDDYFKGLKTNSLLVKGVFDYPMIGGTASTNGVNALDPTNSLVWFGSWTHSINGSLGNGSNTYAKTGIIPSQTIMTYLAGGAFIASGTNNIPVGSDVYDMGSHNSNDETNVFTTRRNSGTTNTAGVVGKLYKELLSPSPYFNALGIHGVNKNGGQVQLWRNAIKEGVPYTSIGNIPTIENYIGAANLTGSPYGYSNQRLQGAVLHGGLTDTQVTQWMNLIDARELALGRKTW